MSEHSTEEPWQDINCCVCLEPLRDFPHVSLCPLEVRGMPCDEEQMETVSKNMTLGRLHGGHTVCLQHWSNNDSRCPVCRVDWHKSGLVNQNRPSKTLEWSFPLLARQPETVHPDLQVATTDMWEIVDTESYQLHLMQNTDREHQRAVLLADLEAMLPPLPDESLNHAADPFQNTRTALQFYASHRYRSRSPVTR